MASILVDEGISRHLVIDLRTQGFDIYHVLDSGPKARHDSALFLEAQQRALTIFTLNRADFLLLATAWSNWGLGHHQGIIAPKPGKQPSVAQLRQMLQHYCADNSSLIDRIELF